MLILFYILTKVLVAKVCVYFVKIYLQILMICAHFCMYLSSIKSFLRMSLYVL